MSRFLRGDALLARAKELGVSLDGLQQGRGMSPEMNEPELQRRVMEAEKHLRDRSMWLLALISALASLASAIAAWIAISMVR